MTPERWRQISEVAASAMELTGDERAAFLDKACKADSELRREVERLLGEDEHAGGFLQHPGAVWEVALGQMLGRGRAEQQADAVSVEGELPGDLGRPPAFSWHALDVDGVAVRQHLDRLNAALSDRYAIERPLGSGGMAVVYLAEDLKHRREVALKVLRPELASALGKERFLREIRLVARLTHPHILPLHDSGEADGLLYYVMPYAKGFSLRVRLQRERLLPLEDVIEIARAVAAALDYAHRHDVVHRDIKPENIMIHDGVAMVTDFGIGKALSTAADNLTVPGGAIGTPAYMSSEQVAGDTQLDGRADIYSLACVTYEMLVGKGPYTAEAALSKQPTDPVPHVTAYRQSVPATLDQAIAKAMAYFSRERFDTAADFARALTTTSIAPTATPRLTPRTPHEESIAVLPFVNLSADAENEHFSDGITEEITNALARVPGLRVVARTSAFAFKGKDHDIRDIGAKLNVSTIVEGSVRKFGRRLRITVQLINVSDGYHLWSERYDRKVKDVFAIQDEIAGTVADKLKSQLTSPQLPGRICRCSLEAYDAYLRGRYDLNKFTDESLKRAIVHFEEAIANDSDYALAYAGLAESYAMIYGGHAVLPGRDVGPKAKAAAQRALELDPTIPEAHVSLGLIAAYYDWDPVGAERAFKQAITLNPNYAAAHVWYALYLTVLEARYEEALAELQRAEVLDPLGLFAKVSVGSVYFLSSDYDHAITQFRKVIDLEPGYAPGHFALGSAYAQMGMLAEGIPIIEEAIRLGGRSVNHIGTLGYAYGLAGQKDKGMQLLGELERRSHEGYMSSFWVAVAYLGLGQTDRVFEWLNRAYEERACALVYFTREPMFDSVRADPRFTALISKMGLEERLSRS